MVGTMADTAQAQDIAAQARQLGADLLAELEQAVAAQTPVGDDGSKEQIDSLIAHALSEISRIVQEYMVQRSALAEQAKTAQIEQLKQQLAA
jgi:hypothetical protein